MDEEAVPILRVANAATALAWYERLGFSTEWEHRFEPGMPAFVSIARGRARLFLSEHRGDARPATLVQLFIKDIDAVVAEFGRPQDEPPYGCQIELRDTDGNRLRISSPTPKFGELAAARQPKGLQKS
jgi:catechol 2,3-dioxygenase-like lactoylglutathione lyase family enzyme